MIFFAVVFPFLSFLVFLHAAHISLIVRNRITDFPYSAVVLKLCAFFWVKWNCLPYCVSSLWCLNVQWFYDKCQTRFHRQKLWGGRLTPGLINTGGAKKRQVSQRFKGGRENHLQEVSQSLQKHLTKWQFAFLFMARTNKMPLEINVILQKSLPPKTVLLFINRYTRRMLWRKTVWMGLFLFLSFNK